MAATISLNSLAVADGDDLTGSCFKIFAACTVVWVAVELSDAGRRLMNVAWSFGPQQLIASMRYFVATAAPPACPTPKIGKRTTRSVGDSLPRAASVNGELSAKYSRAAHHSCLSPTFAGGALFSRARVVRDFLIDRREACFQQSVSHRQSRPKIGSHRLTLGFAMQ